MSKGNEFFIEKHENRYAVLRPDAKRASAVEDTQKAAIRRAKQFDPDAIIHVARVKHTAKGKPDQWRT